MPKFRIPISRKVVGQAIVAGVVACAAALGLDIPPAWEPWIIVGAGLLAGVMVPEGVKFLDYAAERLGLKVIDFTDSDLEEPDRPTLEVPPEAPVLPPDRPTGGTRQGDPGRSQG